MKGPTPESTFGLGKDNCHARCSHAPSLDPQLHAFALGRLPPEEMAGVESHVAVCDSCCQQLQKVPEDTLVHLAREAATFGFRHESSDRAAAKARAARTTFRPSCATIPAIASSG